MSFVNFPLIRIAQYDKGYVVEIQKRKWYGKKYWTHIISASGISAQPWYYSTFEAALENAKKIFGRELTEGTVFHTEHITFTFSS